MLLAQAAMGAGYSFIQIAVLIVVIAAVVGLVYVALRQFGVQIPGFVVQIFWILLCAVLVIAAILFIGRMAGFA